MPAAPLPNHSHCGYCGNPVPYGEEYCDSDCRGLAETEAKRERKKDIIFYAGITGSLILIFVVGVLMRTFL